MHTMVDVEQPTMSGRHITGPQTTIPRSTCGSLLQKTCQPLLKDLSM